jgi:hypothetical protein
MALWNAELYAIGVTIHKAQFHVAFTAYQAELNELSRPVIRP